MLASMERIFALPGDLSQYDETELTEYVNVVVRELIDTHSQQLRLGKRVEQLSSTVSGLARSLGSLTQHQDQLDAKVQTLVLGIDQVHGEAQEAMKTADKAIHEVRYLREETLQQFRQVDETLVSLGSRIDRFIDSVNSAG
jgi:chromosome segregation ATPase